MKSIILAVSLLGLGLVSCNKETIEPLNYHNGATDCPPDGKICDRVIERTMFVDETNLDYVYGAYTTVHDSTGVITKGNYHSEYQEIPEFCGCY